jgi:hypothetical protein
VADGRSSQVRAPTDAEIALAPGPRVRLLAREYGEQTVVRWCRDLLDGAPDAALLPWIGGRHLGGDPRAEGQFWPRSWALRALLYVWDDRAGDAVVVALTDEAWRVREMAAKVVRLRELPAGHLLGPLLDDPLPRVRVAGLRALAVVGEAENAVAVVKALDDGDGGVARAAAGALARLELRLDRRFSQS